MTDQTLETPVRKNPPLALLLGVFLTSLVVAGVVLFVVLQAVLPDGGAATTYDEIITLGDADGVRIINPPRAVADFTMNADTGVPVSISDLRGKHVLLYFGYTHCPDVCPLTLQDLDEVHTMLGDDAQNVEFVFASFDETRDTPEHMGDYLERRNVPYMLGLSGDMVTMRQITPDYNLYYELQEPEENGYYAVDHTANVFLLDPQGRISHIFAYGTTPEAIYDVLTEQF